MSAVSRNSIKLFRLFGITVFLHWSWFIIAAIQLDQRSGRYPSLIWSAAEYVGLFALVLMHEFGHALACRQVGGSAKEILLWPLGGVAYVSPPPRPGAVLWSIAAGPLVNVALIPVFKLAGIWAVSSGWAEQAPMAMEVLRQLAWINFGLLVFNLLPIYPLDGGQILRALLWFPLGAARSLMIASTIGLVGAIGVIGLAVWLMSIWIGVLGLFALSQAWAGFKNARALAQLEAWPRHRGFACPSCHVSPPEGPLWSCAGCGERFDTFAHHAVCPACSARFSDTGCPECGQVHPFSQWGGAPPIPAAEPQR